MFASIQKELQLTALMNSGPRERIARHLFVLLAALSLAGCVKSGSSRATNRGISINQTLVTTVDEFGAESAVAKVGLGVVQDFKAAENGAISGTVVSFPPGSLSVDTRVTIEEAASIATATAATLLGLPENIASSGTAVAVLANDSPDLIQPYQITLAMPAAPELRLQEDSSTLVVFYKVKVVSNGSLLLGYLPLKNLKIAGTSVSFSASHFGAFQVAYTKTLVTEGKEVSTTTPIQTKHEILELVPFAITQREPFVVSAGERITLTGTGFRPAMTVVLGGAKVLGLKIANEESAAFFAPIQPRFGFVDLTANQDGIEQTVTLLYRGVKTDLPIITLIEPEVCSEYQYYDGNGDLKTGTRACEAAAATNLTDSYLGPLRTTIPGPICWHDGQTECMTTKRYKAADTDSSTISSFDIREGRVIAGIRGGRKLCKNQSQMPALDEPPFQAKNGTDELSTIDGYENAAKLAPSALAVGEDISCIPIFWQSRGLGGSSSDGLCMESDEQCTYQDLLTGIIWSKSAPIPLTWPDAVAYCAGTLASQSDWRLPTPKELIQAATNGIAGLHSGNFIGTSKNFWSATATSGITMPNWSVDTSNGHVKSVDNGVQLFVTCVR
jgi:hypothetical protein